MYIDFHLILNVFIFSFFLVALFKCFALCIKPALILTLVILLVRLFL